MKRLGRLIMVIFLMTGALCPTALSSRAEAEATLPSIHVSVKGVRNERGSVSIGLYSKAAGWPVVGQQLVGHFVPARVGSVRSEFGGIRPGRYAVAVYHDENGNRALDMNVFGAPREGVGFSRNARGRFGAPKFSDAVFEVRHSTVRITVSLKY